MTYLVSSLTENLNLVNHQKLIDVFVYLCARACVCVQQRKVC